MSSHARFVVPAATRSRLMLEVASELVGGQDWVERQSRVQLRRQGSDDWALTLFASDSPQALEDVASGRAQVAIVNPSEPLTMAVRGTGPFASPLPLRAITVLPSEDQIAFAVAASTGLTSLEEVRERRYPLRISLRSQPHHAVHLVIHAALRAAGFSLEDVVSWGGEVRYDAQIAHAPVRLEAAARGEITAIFDEAVNRWLDQALGGGMRVLSLGEPLLAQVEAAGLRRAVIRQTDYAGLPADVATLDFSGWSVFTRDDAPDALITAFCAALEARKDRIPWQGDGPLPLDRMCRDGADTPLDVPLHPAAERFWRDRGYLP